MRFCERSRLRRAEQAANAAAERVALRLLLEMEREEREGRRQSAAAGTGPERLRSERSTEVTAAEGLHVTAVQLHGVASRRFQEESALLGSDSWSLAWRRKRPSWFRESVGFRERNRNSVNNKKWLCSTIVVVVFWFEC